MSDDLSGRNLGRYQILERLGRGGMAEVYRAYQPSLDRYVAIKVIYPHLAADEALRDRFGREARAVAALHHPNVVQVYDFDVQAGVAFMAMEFIAGPTLKAAMQSLHRRGLLPPPPLVGSIVAQIAEALAYAHDQGLVHRDVKPANVLLRRHNPTDAALNDATIDTLLHDLGPSDVVLTDFGVARILKDSVEHTAAGTILGSPAYMSPEQGRGERADRRSDIYSLGVVLFELLTGQVPFDADTPFAIVLKHTTAPLPPPRALRPDLPAGLERVLLKALAKDPADRFQDAAAFGAAVRQEANRWALGASAPQIAAAPAPAYDDRATRVVELTTATPPPIAPQPESFALPPVASPPQTQTPVAPKKRRQPLRMLVGCLLTLGLVVVVALVAFFAGGLAVFRGLSEVGAVVVPTQFQAEATAIAATIVAEGGTPPQFFSTPTAIETPTALPAVVATAIAQAEDACSATNCPDGGAALALSILDDAVAANPNNADLYAARALLMVRVDPYTYRAQIEADIAAAQTADAANAWAELARGQLAAVFAEEEDRYDEARDAFDRAVELAPNDPVARLARAEFLTQSPDYYAENSSLPAQVLADASVVLAADPANVAALVLRGMAYTESNQPGAALADFDTVLAQVPNNRAALLRRADLYHYAFEDLNAAVADYSAVLADNSNDYDALFGRLSVAIELARYADALEDALTLAAIEPADPAIPTLIGHVRLQLDAPVEALADFERACYSTRNISPRSTGAVRQP
ncbi:MAG: protein kinase, partial [Blastochloris sp.]|nr:protein kinase [Blastochloris sp.]